MLLGESIKNERLSRRFSSSAFHIKKNIRRNLNEKNTPTENMLEDESGNLDSLKNS